MPVEILNLYQALENRILDAKLPKHFWTDILNVECYFTEMLLFVLLFFMKILGFL